MCTGDADIQAGPLPTPQRPGQVPVAKRDAAWLQSAAPRLQQLLSVVLPPLCLHPSQAVRAALAAGV